MTNFTARITAAVFCGTLFLLGLLHAVLPDREFSSAERRRLAQFPEMSAETLSDGVFMQNLERYLPDAFPAREGFRSLKALFETASGRLDTGGVWRKNGYFTELAKPFSPSAVRKTAEKLEKVRQILGCSRNYLCLIPPKDVFLADGVHPVTDLDSLTEVLYPEAASFTPIPIRDALSLDSYYRTDSHWRQEMLDPVVRRLLDGMGIEEEIPAEDTVREFGNFRGVYAGRSALPCRAETLRWRVNEFTESAVVSSVGAEVSSVYAEELLTSRRSLDPYDVFLGGAVPLLTVTNPLDVSGRELIVIRDSFGSSLIPLLIPYFHTVTAVDLRYLSARILPELPELAGVRSDGADLLVLLSAGVLSDSEMLKTD